MNALSWFLHGRKGIARLLSLGLALAMLLGSLITAPAAPAHAAVVEAEELDFADLLDVNRAMAHTVHLSEVIGPRVSGFPEEYEGALYIKAQLESWGYDVELEPFTRPNRTMGMFSLSSGEEWQVGSATQGRQTGDETVTGELVWAGSGQNASDFPEDVEGKIVVMIYGSNSTQRNTQVTNAFTRGAAAVALANQQGARGARGGTPTPSFSPNRNIPVIGIGQGQGESLRDRIADGEKITGTIQTHTLTGLVSHNVIATRKAVGPDADNAPIVYFGSHLDSVLGSPGANDSAASVAINLEIARVMAQYGAGDKELRYGYWGSEESGLIGSTRHANAMPAAEVARIIAMFQPDMIATNSDRVTHLLAHSVDGKPNTVTEAARIAAEKRGVEQYYQQGQFGSSDHVPFHNRGVPAALFIWMTYSSPSVYQLEDKYHTPEDTVAENISIERMGIALEMLGQGFYDIVQPPPAITITSPENGHSTQRSSVVVEGTARDPLGPVTVTVDGEEVDLDEDGSFSEPVILDDGANDIVITATSADGRVGTVTLRVYSDNEAPELTDLEPSEDVTIEQGESITVSFTSEPGLTAGFDVLLPGTFKLMSTSLGEPMTETSPGHYEGTYTAPADAIFAGAEIQFNATDAAGNLTQTAAPGTLTVVPYVAPPELTVTEPVDGLLTQGGYVTVKGIVVDSTDEVVVTVNGEEVDVDEDGNFSEIVFLNEGDNPIDVVATNAAGKSTTVSLNVVRDTTPPVLSDIEPAEDVLLAQGESLTIRFRSETGLDAAYDIDLGLMGTASMSSASASNPMTEVSDGVYEATYTAPTNASFTNARVFITAVDAAGNEAQAYAPGRITVAASPELDVTSPDDGLRTGLDVITVAGTVSDPLGVKSVTVNGRKATVKADGSFSLRIILSAGTNTVTIVAENNAGLTTTVTRTVEAVWAPPALTDLEPAEDITLEAGESYVFRFKSAPGLTATYQVVLGGASGTTIGKGAPRGTAMTEVSPGVYEATYTAPSNTTFTNAAVRFNAADDVGNLIMQTAPGRLSVRPAGPAEE